VVSLFCPNCQSQLEGTEKKRFFKCPKCGKAFSYVNNQLREIVIKKPTRTRKPFFKDFEDFVKKTYSYYYDED